MELFVFIRSLPQFAGNTFEELERMEPYLEVLRFEEGEPAISGTGWSLVYQGKLALPSGSIFQRGNTLYHGQKNQLRILEPVTLVFFSEHLLENLLREEPELAVSLVEQMVALKRQWERAQI